MNTNFKESTMDLNKFDLLYNHHYIPVHNYKLGGDTVFGPELPDIRAPQIPDHGPDFSIGQFSSRARAELEEMFKSFDPILASQYETQVPRPSSQNNLEGNQISQPSIVDGTTETLEDLEENQIRRTYGAYREIKVSFILLFSL